VSSLSAVATLFACSLVAALVLFKILQSTAAIQKKEYQVGGAAAGFLVIYAALYGSYAQLQKAPLAACQAQLAVDEHELPIQGVVEPPIKNATIVLAVRQVSLADDGRFGLQVKGVDPTRDPLSLYVIAEKTHSYYQIFPSDNTANLKINAGGN
jgi:hypothetical protein